MKKKIVVVENDKDILEIIYYILTNEGYSVKTFLTGEVTTSKVIKEKPDLILLDIITITEEGTALCSEFKKNSQTEMIPIVVLSTHPKAHSVKEICADETINKPFDIQELLLIVRDQLEQAL